MNKILTAAIVAVTLTSGCLGESYEEWLVRTGQEDPRPAANAWCAQNPQECAATNARGRQRYNQIAQQGINNAGNPYLEQQARRQQQRQQENRRVCRTRWDGANYVTECQNQ